MIGDSILFKPIHHKKTDKVFPAVSCLGNRKIVVIGGEAGTGKTEIALLLQKRLWEDAKIRAKIIHLDDYYITNWQERNKVRKEKGIEYVGTREINWKKLSAIVKRFRTNQKKIYVQRIHKYTNSIEHVIVSGKKVDILIFEGLYALNLPDFDYGIYLEGNYMDTFKFRKERAKEDPNCTFRQAVLRREHKEVISLKSKAHTVIPFEI